MGWQGLRESYHSAGFGTPRLTRTHAEALKARPHREVEGLRPPQLEFMNLAGTLPQLI